MPEKARSVNHAALAGNDQLGRGPRSDRAAG